MPSVRTGNAELYAHSVSLLVDQEPVHVTDCPICGANRAGPRFQVEGFTSQVVVCTGCGLGRLEPSPDADLIRSLYPDDYYGVPGIKFHPLIERLVRFVGARQCRFISRHLSPGARILDVGCGRGVMLRALADRGFEVHGTDISATATHGADPRAEIRIVPQLSAARYPDAFFDVVVIWHVLEHLADPRGTLQEVHRILKPGGRLVVAVPNFSSIQAQLTGTAWFHLDLPRHLYQFPLEALQRLLAGTGFDVRSNYHFSLRQNPFGWIQSVLNLLPGLPRNGLYTLLHRRGSGELPVYPWAIRLLLRLLLILSAPPALVATLAGTVLRRGATVHVVAVRRPDDSPSPPG